MKILTVFFIVKLILTVWQFLFIESKENIFIIIINIPYLLEVSKVAVTKKENGKKGINFLNSPTGLPKYIICTVRLIKISHNTKPSNIRYIYTGLSLGAGGRGFSPATKRVAPGYIYWKIVEK